MSEVEEVVAVLDEAMSELAAKRPYSKGLIDAFGPVIRAKRRLLVTLTFPETPLTPVDVAKFEAGVPLLRQQSPFLAEDPWQDIADGLIPAFQEGLLGLRQDLELIRVRLASGDIQLFDAIRDYPAIAVPIAAWSSQCVVQPAAIELLLSLTAQVVLAKRAAAVAPFLSGLDWGKGYCPVCGAFPMLAFIRQKGQRWLHCAVCAHEWRFARVTCPYCEYNGQAGTTCFFVDEAKDEYAVTCEQCHRYLLTVKREEVIAPADSEITAIGLAHLDLMMQERGFQPMARCVWNQF